MIFCFSTFCKQSVNPTSKVHLFIMVHQSGISITAFQTDKETIVIFKRAVKTSVSLARKALSYL